MKILYLLRHAKSSWDDPDLKDFERPLNARGLRDVPVMADRFNARNCRVDCIVSSPATRAKTTAGLFSEAIDYKG
ncbi:MAG TPA: phosphohistidine phosphatase, partial [Gammaproteobacteria bacterium]|nr:phosphohistidine phosphatase [Gammaproteobacteria bacterium]